MKISEDLKPCPFCGSTKLFISEEDYDGGVPALDGTTYFSVWCSKCSALVASSNDDTEQKAIEHWNTRKGEMLRDC